MENNAPAQLKKLINRDMEHAISLLHDCVAAAQERDSTQRLSDNLRPHTYLFFDHPYGHTILPLKSLVTSPKFILTTAVKMRSLPIVCRLLFSSTKIEVKNNIRIFGCGSDQNLTMKIALRRKSLRGEIRARRILTDKLARLSLVPRMVDYDNSNSRWLLEETIKDTGTNEQKLDYFLRYCQPFYEATSRLKPIKSGIRHKLMSWSSDSIKARLSMLENDGQKYWPVALGHGDLSTGNMLFDRNHRFALCDFERASFRPVARDLAKLYIKHPKDRWRILEALGKLSGEDQTAIDAESQMAMCIALRAIRFEEILENKRAYRADKFGEGPGHFRTAISNIIRESSLLIDSLLTSYRCARIPLP